MGRKRILGKCILILLLCGVVYAAVGDIKPTANIVTKNGKYLGLGASKGRLTFNDATVDYLQFDDCHLYLKNRYDVRFWDSTETYSVGWQAPTSLSSDLTFDLPSSYGSSGQVLSSSGSGGAFSWITPSSWGYIENVWTGSSGDISALAAATGDTLDASSADSSIPWKVGTSSPTTEGQAVWNSTSDYLAIGDGSGTKKVVMTGSDAVLSSVEVGDGTASNPSISFTSETTGIYRSGTGSDDAISFVIDGVRCFYMEAGGIYVSDSASDYFGKITFGGTEMTANRTLTLDLDDGARTLKLSGNLTVEAASIINSDLSTDAPWETSGTITGGNLTTAGTATAGKFKGSAMSGDGIIITDSIPGNWTMSDGTSSITIEGNSNINSDLSTDADWATTGSGTFGSVVSNGTISTKVSGTTILTATTTVDTSETPDRDILTISNSRDNDIHLAFQPGSSGSGYRGYMRWNEHDGDLMWVMGRSSTNTFILYGGNGSDPYCHFLQVNAYSNTLLSSGGTGAVQINNYGDAQTGTGGFEVYSGGASPSLVYDIDSSGNVYNTGVLSVPSSKQGIRMSGVVHDTANASGRIFWNEGAANDLYGFSFIYAGAANPTLDGTAFTLSANTLYLLRHNNSATGAEALTFARTGNITVNNAMADADFIIKGDTDAALVYVDAGNDRVGISDSTPSYTLDVDGTFQATGNSIVGGTLSVTGTVSGAAGSTFGGNKVPKKLYISAQLFPGTGSYDATSYSLDPGEYVRAYFRIPDYIDDSQDITITWTLTTNTSDANDLTIYVGSWPTDNSVAASTWDVEDATSTDFGAATADYMNNYSYTLSNTNFSGGDLVGFALLNAEGSAIMSIYDCVFEMVAKDS